MKFEVIPNYGDVPENGKNIAYLRADNLSDIDYNTTYHLYFFDLNGKRYNIGELRIEQFNMQAKQLRSHIPKFFEKLDDKFFSLGQDVEYYTNIQSIKNKNEKNKLLYSLNDIVADQKLYSLALLALNKKATRKSLPRFLPNNTTLDQFRRILSGGARLTEYKFSFCPVFCSVDEAKPIELSFNVIPDSKPPTNIHVLVGSNGVGKSHLLNSMIQVLLSNDINNGRFYSQAEERDFPFANLVFVSFSAFDNPKNVQNLENLKNGIQYTYVGLQKSDRIDVADKTLTTKSPEDLALEFSNSAQFCAKGSRINRWKATLNTLEADPIFADAEIANLMDLPKDAFYSESQKIFNRLSSGHKIVLLTVTRLVECVREKTLVLMEEPESHLHPPLLSFFMRALSDLLVNRNGVAIVATHSPIVLQEVPRQCVWKINRHGQYITARRPDIQTFAENVGIITSDVFGLGIGKLGFYNLLHNELRDANCMEEVLAQFNGNIGTEGRALISSLIEHMRIAEQE